MLAPREHRKYVERGDVTNERLAKAEGFTFTDDMRRRWMRDSPIWRAVTRGAITGGQFEAAVRFAQCWHGAGFSGSVGSLDLNRIMSRDTTQFSYLATSDKQANDRKEYAAAVQVLGKLAAATVEHVVCYEIPLEAWGRANGRGTKQSAIIAAEEQLKAALSRLCEFWRIEDI